MIAQEGSRLLHRNPLFQNEGKTLRVRYRWKSLLLEGRRRKEEENEKDLDELCEIIFGISHLILT